MFVKHYGGAESSAVTPTICKDDDFAKALNKVLGPQIRADDNIAQMVWCSLASRDWHHKDGHTASYSHRAAADLVAAVRGEGNYLDWYHNDVPGYVDPIVAMALENKGWEPMFMAHEIGCFPPRLKAHM